MDAVAVPVVVQAVVVCRPNTAALDPAGSLGTDLEWSEMGLSRSHSQNFQFDLPDEFWSKKGKGIS